MSRTPKQTTAVSKKNKSGRSRRTTKPRSAPTAGKKSPQAASIRLAVTKSKAKPKTAEPTDASKQQVLNITEQGIETASRTSVSARSTGIFATVKNLEKQVKTAFKLKKALQTDLDVTRRKLSKQLSEHAKSDGKIKQSKTSASQAERSGQGISFVDTQRNFASLLEQLRDMTSRLAATNTSNSALKADLARVNDSADALRSEVADLHEKLNDAGNQIADLRDQLGEQQIVNSRLESEMKTKSLDIEAARNELNVFKNTFRRIRSEATRTSSRVSRRYFNPRD